jgi:activator of HSP90 ATPase
MNVIRQSTRFDASPKELFITYTDSKKHSAATGVKSSMSARPGAKFTAFGGMISGQNLMVVPGEMIVQRWRSKHFHKTDPDSILILKFFGDGNGGRIDLVHVNVPDQDFEGVKKGWPQHYWKHWKTYLKK